MRLATLADVPHIMPLIDHSRSIMRANGNNVQWAGYPGPDLIGSDIAKGIGHVIMQQDHPVGYFALLQEPEPTYAVIEEGLWLDDTTPYNTLHRLACAPGVQGIAKCAFSFAESRCASVRVDTHLANSIMLHIIQSRLYTRCGVVYMRDGTPREAFQKMMYPMVTPSLRQYVEQFILPQYSHFDAAHGVDHVQRVIAQSMELMGKLSAQGQSGLDADMVYTIAAYHDTGISEGRETHHLFSGRIIRNDQRLKEWFTCQEIETMAQAAEDHRASLKGLPRSLYGMIVAEADRDIEPITVVRRTIAYGLAHHPELDTEALWQRTLKHLHEKYDDGGYLRLYVDCSRNAHQLALLRQLIHDPSRLRQLFDLEMAKASPLT